MIFCLCSRQKIKKSWAKKLEYKFANKSTTQYGPKGVMTSSEFRSLYRELMHLSMRIPNEQKRGPAVALVRERFRKEAVAELNDNVVSAFAKEARSRVGFLKMMTPKVITESLAFIIIRFFHQQTPWLPTNRRRIGDLGVSRRPSTSAESGSTHRRGQKSAER